MELGHLLREPLRNGHSAKAAETGGLRTLTLTAVTEGDFGEHNTKLTVADPEKVAGLWLEPGDILIERSNTPELVGTARAYQGPEGYAIFPDLMIRARIVDEIPTRFVELYLQSPQVRTYFRKCAQGIAGSMPKIGQGHVEALPVRVPPGREQHEIVRALDSHLSRLDAAVAGLERAQANLKRYRASVLQSAVEGRLVPTEAELAREEGRDYEPAEVLLDRILTERRRRWEEAELERLEAKGKPPANAKWKSKYKEPVEPDTAELPVLPEGWCWATVEQLLTIPLSNGRSVRTAKEGSPVLRLTALRGNRIELSERKTGEWSEEEARPYLVERGDVLVARGNGSIRLVARGGLVDQDPDPVAFPDTMIRFRVNEAIYNRTLFSIIWNSPVLRVQVEAKAKTTAGIFKVNQQDLGSCLVPVPPRQEQEPLLAELEKQDTVICESQRVIETATARCEVLRQAILAWAFSGKVADQDPTDEPAVKLIERICADRAARPKTRKKVRRRKS